MTSIERRLLKRTIIMGAAITLLVIVADFLGWLVKLERPLYDFDDSTRARDCQFFTPKPTKDLYHVDIDDPSLAEIGSFPWPRQKLAEMTDEITRAGAKVLAMDVLFAEPQLTRYEKPDEESNAYRVIDDDADFAAAIKRAGNVLLPLSGNFRTKLPTPLENQLVDILSADSETNASTAELRIHSQDASVPIDLSLKVKELYDVASQRAMFNRIDGLFGAGVTELAEIEKRLTPRAVAAGERTDDRLLLQRIFPRVQAVRSILRFGRPIPPDAPPLLTATEEVAVTLPSLSAVIKSCGAADFQPDGDGVIRSVPLFVSYRGKLFPQSALAIACALLQVPIGQVQIEPNSVTLPKPDGTRLVIPVRTIRSANFGEIGMFMAIPWFGTDEYVAAFDWPAHRNPTQHIPLLTVWRICQTEHDIKTNERRADQVLTRLARVLPGVVQRAAAYVQQPESARTSQERAAVIADTVQKLVDNDYPALETVPAAEVNEKDREGLEAYRTLHGIMQENPKLLQSVESKRASLKSQLNNKAILIGWTATGAHDIYNTSIHAHCPGVAALGMVINAIVTNHVWWPAPEWMTATITLFIGLIVTVAVAWLSTVRAMIATLCLMTAYFVLNGIVLFDKFDLIFGVAAPLTAAFLCWSSLTVAQQITERREKRRITDRFRSYADPKLVNYVLEHPDEQITAGQVKEVTVVFTDLAGFTTISEKLGEATVPMLNDYMSLMLPIIRNNNGYWNKFLGDGIMFFFNAPDDDPQHASRAVRTVLEMQQAMVQFNEKLIAQGLPKCSMRAGVSCGRMVVGDAGSIDPIHKASDYTVLGDLVNLGARLESANKATGTRTLLNERAAELAGGEYLLRPVGKLQVVGKTEGIRVFEALCIASEATEEQWQIASMSRKIVDAYARADFDGCIEAARQMEEKFGSAKFTQLYLHLCMLYIGEPPGPDFDGLIILESK